MINDVELGCFANCLGILVVSLVILYHYILPSKDSIYTQRR